MSFDTHWVESYINEQNRSALSIPKDQVRKVLHRLLGCYKTGKLIVAIGNGGSAANASHFIEDLAKGASDKMEWVHKKRFKALALNDTPYITALANDYSYDDIFVKQLENFKEDIGLLIGISVSGTSPNLIRSFEFAQKNNIDSVALVCSEKANKSRDEGKQNIADMCEISIEISGNHYGRVEDAQMHCLHIFAYYFIENAGLIGV